MASESVTPEEQQHNQAPNSQLSSQISTTATEDIREASDHWRPVAAFVTGSPVLFFIIGGLLSLHIQMPGYGLDILALGCFLGLLGIRVYAPIALWRDARALENSDIDVQWAPRYWLMAIVGLIPLIPIGFVVCAYYLIRRASQLGVPSTEPMKQRIAQVWARIS